MLGDQHYDTDLLGINHDSISMIFHIVISPGEYAHLIYNKTQNVTLQQFPFIKDVQSHQQVFLLLPNERKTHYFMAFILPVKTEPKMRSFKSINTTDFNESSSEIWQLTQTDLIWQRTQTDLIWQRTQTDLIWQHTQTDLIWQRTQTDLIWQRTQTDLIWQRTQTDLIWQRTQTDLIWHRTQTDLIWQRTQTDLIWQHTQTDLIWQRTQTDLSQRYLELACHPLYQGNVLVIINSD